MQIIALWDLICVQHIQSEAAFKMIAEQCQQLEISPIGKLYLCSYLMERSNILSFNVDDSNWVLIRNELFN